MHATETDADRATAVVHDRPWVTIVWDDPVNLMSYVTLVFQRHFGMTVDDAERHMLQVHHEGRSILASGAREHMELHVQAMHAYGLQSTLERVDA